jgi:hypothetical protein
LQKKFKPFYVRFPSNHLAAKIGDLERIPDVKFVVFAPNSILFLETESEEVNLLLICDNSEYDHVDDKLLQQIILGLVLDTNDRTEHWFGASRVHGINGSFS